MARKQNGSFDMNEWNGLADDSSTWLGSQDEWGQQPGMSSGGWGAPPPPKRGIPVWVVVTLGVLLLLALGLVAFLLLRDRTPEPAPTPPSLAVQPTQSALKQSQPAAVKPAPTPVPTPTPKSTGGGYYVEPEPEPAYKADRYTIQIAATAGGLDSAIGCAQEAEVFGFPDIATRNYINGKLMITVGVYSDYNDACNLLPYVRGLVRESAYVKHIDVDYRTPDSEPWSAELAIMFRGLDERANQVFDRDDLAEGDCYNRSRGLYGTGLYDANKLVRLNAETSGISGFGGHDCYIFFDGGNPYYIYLAYSTELYFDPVTGDLLRLVEGGRSYDYNAGMSASSAAVI